MSKAPTKSCCNPSENLVEFYIQRPFWSQPHWVSFFIMCLILSHVNPFNNVSNFVSYETDDDYPLSSVLSVGALFKGFLWCQSWLGQCFVDKIPLWKFDAVKLVTEAHSRNHCDDVPLLYWPTQPVSHQAAVITQSTCHTSHIYVSRTLLIKKIKCFPENVYIRWLCQQRENPISPRNNSQTHSCGDPAHPENTSLSSPWWWSMFVPWDLCNNALIFLKDLNLLLHELEDWVLR